MGWQDIDLFEMESSGFSEELHAVIVPLFEEGTQRLADWEKDRQATREKMICEAKDEEQADYAHNVADYEGWRNEQRGQVLGAAGLHYLYSTLRSGLKQLARYFDKTHLRSTKPYKGKSELDRLKEEFAQRFGVDFEKSTLFASVRELALARNAGIHPESLSEYTQKVQSPRFCKGGEFNVEPKAFMDVLNETEQFFDWVVKQMLPLRKAQGKPLGKPSSKSSG
jgi:hypothetical protein